MSWMEGRVTFLPLLLGVALIIPLLWQAASINYASLQYLFARTGETRAIAPSAHPRTDIWLALQSLSEGDSRGAINFVRQEAEAGNEMALQITAQAHETLGNYSAATAIWRTQSNATALRRVAETARAEDNLAAAEDAYRALWRVDPVQGTIQYARFLERENADWNKAETILRDSIATYPASYGYPYWLLLLAENLASQGRWAEAARVYEQMLPVIWRMYEGDREKLPRYRADMAWALFMSGQPQEAMAAMEQALAGETELYVLRQAGQLYEEADERGKAVNVYRQWLQIRPDDALAQDALERLGDPDAE